MKHILSKFYLNGKLPDKIDYNKLDQSELNETFSDPKDFGFLFDEIIYLTAPQEAFDKLSSRRFSYKRSILEDKLVKRRFKYFIRRDYKR
ncbi:MAG: hypothetical protein IPH20_13675 [Bacteroidales bacterium]|nr:hypothetical protein [Bacteroidales bacterium]